MDLPNESRPDVQLRTVALDSAGDGSFTGRLVPYESPVELWDGVWEVFSRGALSAAVKDPGRVKVRGVDHERSVIGMASELTDRTDGLWGTFRLAGTAAAQEARALMDGGFVDELSIEFQQLPKQRTITERDDGSMLIRHDRARLLGVAPAGHGAYGRGATVVSVRSLDLDGARQRELAILRALRA
jgi:HK97 family phage prohead protease